MDEVRRVLENQNLHQIKFHSVLSNRKKLSSMNISSLIIEVQMSSENFYLQKCNSLIYSVYWALAMHLYEVITHISIRVLSCSQEKMPNSDYSMSSLFITCNYISSIHRHHEIDFKKPQDFEQGI